MRRRHLIQAGLAGTALLGAAAWWGPRLRDPGSLSDVSTGDPSPVLPPGAAAVVAALAPVVIGSACHRAEHRERAVQGVGVAVSRLSPGAQREIGELFSLLAWAPARGPLTGVWTDWADASADNITAFLQRWRFSRLEMLQSGYHALHDLILGGWYADDRHWEAMGYPGPPVLPTSA